MAKISTPQTNGTTEKVRRVLFNEVSFIISIIGLTIGVFVYLTNPAQENMREIEKLRAEVETNRVVIDTLNTIQNNDLHTLQQKAETTEQKLNDIENQLIKLETILNERLPER